MRNLRTQFGKELGKVRASKVSGTSALNVYNPTWKWFNVLVFLKDRITPVKTKPTPGVPPAPSTSAELDTADTAALQPEIEHADQETGQDPDEHTSESRNKQPKTLTKKKVLDLENKVLEKSMSVFEDILNKRRPHTQEEKDGDVIFGKHVCHSLKEIKNRRTKEFVKLKIQQLLFDAEFSSRGNSLDQMNEYNPTHANMQLFENF